MDLAQIKENKRKQKCLVILNEFKFRRKTPEDIEHKTLICINFWCIFADVLIRKQIF